MTIADKVISEIKSNREKSREEFKVALQGMVDRGEVEYSEAIRIMEESRLFEVSSFILGKHESKEPIDMIFNWYDNGLEYKYQVIMFSDIVEWMDYIKDEVTEEFNAIDTNPYKVLYDYAMETNYIGYTFDW